MTTIRRLIVELGIDGDLNVKRRLQEVQTSANSLKNTLEVLEKSFITFGAGMKGIPFLGGVSSGVLQTRSERRVTAELERSIKEQTQSEKERADKQLEATKESSNIQGNILKALETQTSTQSDVITQMIDENKRDRDFIREFLKDITGFVDEKLFAIIRQAKSTGEVGRPSPSKVKTFKEERLETGRRIQTMSGTTKDILLDQEVDDILRVEEVQKNQNIVNIAKKEARQTMQMAKGSITEPEIFEFDPTQGQKQVQALKQQGVEFEFPELESLETETTDPLERLKNEFKELKSDLNEQRKQERLPIDTPFARKVAITRQLLEEQEKRELAEEAQKIRERLEPSLEREARAKKRGFVFKPARKLAEFRDESIAKVEQFKEDIKTTFAGFLTKRIKGFKTPEQIAEETAEDTNLLKQKAEEIISTPEGKRIVNQTFNFYNPVIDSEEKKDEIINAVVLALK
jgi:hypothetical protein